MLEAEGVAFALAEVDVRAEDDRATAELDFPFDQDGEQDTHLGEEAERALRQTTPPPCAGAWSIAHRGRRPEALLALIDEERDEGSLGGDGRADCSSEREGAAAWWWWSGREGRQATGALGSGWT